MSTTHESTSFLEDIAVDNIVASFRYSLRLEAITNIEIINGIRKAVKISIQQPAIEVLAELNILVENMADEKTIDAVCRACTAKLASPAIIATASVLKTFPEASGVSADECVWHGLENIHGNTLENEVGSIIYTRAMQ